MSDSIVHVDLGERAYDIVIGGGALADIGSRCAELFGSGKRILMVSDANVAEYYVSGTEALLIGAGFQVSVCVLPAGESTKCVARLAEIWEEAVEARLDRKSFIVALGGGVIGDLAGFAAASFLRGIPFVQVPTSLLAMVDSAVGGKTGMNLPQGKNLVGAFHQPNLVLADLSVLATLPLREQHAGMAEVIKYGVIWDPEMFAFIESHVAEIQALDSEAMRYLVKRSCEIKADVVRQDEREGGLRAILNFGHTLGHAIENVCGYGEWLHGEAISIGMVYAAKVSEVVNGFSSAETDRLIALFKAFELPVSWKGLCWEDLYKAMTADKKAENALPKFVLAEEMGKVGLPLEVSVELLKRVYDDGA
ncbi:3-dehydroquinate synthase [Kiritimatiellaeota bacterium B1221]|nr:3-dehydroquinate synthase [Kiritimatiellaeota bacterium B1221]